MRHILFLFLLLSAPATAQHYGDMWFFGNLAGIDFRQCTPVADNTGSNSGFEGCSSICDNTGQILFYTNSDQVWDRQHLVMPNGNINSTGGTISQVIIVPVPSSATQYYIFTTQVQALGTLRLQYHTVDMSLNNGFGDVLNQNNVVDTTIITEQVAATYHSNGTDIWLMTHGYGTNQFRAWLITASGIAASPVVSAVGPAHQSCNSNINARGEIKFSPNRAKIAFNANGIGTDDSTNILMLADFNNSTGVVSNPINLPFMRGDFGLSFSPDNSKLYGATWKAFAFGLGDFNYLYQFDLSSGNPATIAASRTVIDSTTLGGSYGSLKIGPDAKIYVARNGQMHLGVINSPNLAGAACNYQINGFYLGANCSFGLSNHIEYQIYCTGKIGMDEYEEEESFSFSPNPATDQIEVMYSGKGSVSVIDLSGKIILRQKVACSRETLNLQGLAAGMYFVRLSAENGKNFSRKLIISQ